MFALSASFLLTHPVWDVTWISPTFHRLLKFLLTHPVWDVTESIPLCLRSSDTFLLTHPVWDVTCDTDKPRH